jgi:hypothetical protein
MDNFSKSGVGFLDIWEYNPKKMDAVHVLSAF